MTRREFFDAALEAAIAARDDGAPISPVIVAAQAAHESNWGESQLAREANNLFGIKAGSRWDGDVLRLPTREFYPERGWVRTEALWRRYPTWAACFADYGSILSRLPWYADAVEAAQAGDPEGFLDGIVQKPGEPGWATDPNYKELVWNIARMWATGGIA